MKNMESTIFVSAAAIFTCAALLFNQENDYETKLAELLDRAQNPTLSEEFHYCIHNKALPHFVKTRIYNNWADRLSFLPVIPETLLDIGRAKGVAGQYAKIECLDEELKKIQEELKSLQKLYPSGNDI